MGMMIHRRKLRVAKEAALNFSAEKEIVVKENEETVEIEKTENEVKEEKKYTKSDIAKLSTSELQNLASKEGINNANKLSGIELKKILIKHFGL